VNLKSFQYCNEHHRQKTTLMSYNCEDFIPIAEDGSKQNRNVQ